MSYLGKVDMNDANIQRYTLTSSTASTVLFSALGWTPANIQSLRVTINGVVQQNISLTSTALDLGGALVLTDELEVIGIESMGNILTPADNSVTTAKLVDDAVTEPKLSTTGVAGAATFLSGTMAWTAVAGTSVTTTKTTGTTTLTDSDASGYVTVPCDSSGGNVIIKLPAAASSWSGSILHIVASAAPGAGYNVVIQNSAATELAQLNKKGDYYIVTCDSAGSNLVVIDNQQSYGAWIVTTNDQSGANHSLATAQMLTNPAHYTVNYDYGSWWDSSADKLTVPSGWVGNVIFSLDTGVRSDPYCAISIYKDSAMVKNPILYSAAGGCQPFDWEDSVTGGEEYSFYSFGTYSSGAYRYIKDGATFQWTGYRSV